MRLLVGHCKLVGLAVDGMAWGMAEGRLRFVVALHFAGYTASKPQLALCIRETAETSDHA